MTSPPGGPVTTGATPSSAGGLTVVTNLGAVGIRVNLRLRFLDPDGVARDFPAGLTVRVGTQDYQVQAQGRLTFPAPASSPPGSFTLQFPAANPRYVLCEPWTEGGSPPAAGGGSPPSYPSLADAAPDNTDRCFMLPADFGSPLAPWALVNSDWTLSDETNVTYDAAEGILQHTDQAQPIGTSGRPSVLTLDPKWLYFRFEFFDRYYGRASVGSPPGAAHGARISTPPVPLEGFRNDRAAAGTTPDTMSRWAVGDDAKTLYHCLPFIVRRTHAKVSLVDHLDGQHVGLRFKYADDRYIHSESATVRNIIAIPAGDARLNPGPERLRYYDLPKVWKSRQYYTRWTDPSAGGAFFHQPGVDTAKLGGATTRAKALSFSLDDIVLYQESGADIVPLSAFAASDRVAVFNHRFDNTVGGAGTTTHGLFKEQTNYAGMPDRFNIPQSDVTATRTPAADATAKDTYLFEYPDWTRLVVTQGNLFDVFSQRAPDIADADRVVGARAAVRHIDATAPLPGITTSTHPSVPAVATPANTPSPGRYLSGRPARVDRPTASPTFVLQPFHWQLRTEFPKAYDAANSSRIGRFDMLFLRCCDVNPRGEEVAINLHYIRTYWANDTDDAAGRQRARDIAINTANRWNGNDTINDCRAAIGSERSPPEPLKVHVVWFSQAVEQAKAHFGLTGSAGRSSRGSGYGNGDYKTSETGGDANGWFTTAHESGHENGLPDDYNERWGCASYDMLSFRHNGPPGDPYEPDGRDDQNVYGTTSGGILSASMMNVNSRLRGRYYWPSAEWVSRIVGFPCLVRFTDIETTPAATYDYKLPQHAGRSDDKTYLSWPLLNSRNATRNASPPTTSPPTPPTGAAWDKFQYDLYALGKDHFSQHALGAQVNAARGARGLAALAPAPRFDGILVIGTRLKCTFPGNAAIAAEDTNRKDLAVRIAAAVRKGLSHRWCASGTFSSQRFDNILIHFAPQIVVHNDPHAHYAAAPPAGKGWTGSKSPASLIAEYGIHFDLEARASAAAPPRASSSWDIAGRKLTVDMRPGQAADLDAQLQNEFAKFLGFDKTCANVTVADVTSIVNLLGGTSVAVAEIT